MGKVKIIRRRAGGTRISSKHQVTIPVKALREAGLRVGEYVVARVDGPGRVVLQREENVLDEFAGQLTGIYERDEVDRLREEWV